MQVILGGDHRPVIDASVPRSARVWNYWLGGKDNYPADQAFGEQIRALMPGIVDIARASRGFLHRAVRYLAGEVGIRQFLDVGPGLPTLNTHHVAQGIAPDCRIVYVDHDPLVLAHARALLTSTPQGSIAYLDANLREPEKILQHAARTLDLAQPIALMLLGVLNYITDDDEAHAIVTHLLNALPAGSYLQEQVSIRDLASELGRRPSLVRRLLDEAGVCAETTSCVGVPESEVAAVLAARYREGVSLERLSDDTGVSLRELAKLTRCSYSTIRRVLLQAGVDLRSSGAIPSSSPALETDHYHD